MAGSLNGVRQPDEAAQEITFPIREGLEWKAQREGSCHCALSRCAARVIAAKCLMKWLHGEIDAFDSHEQGVDRQHSSQTCSQRVHMNMITVVKKKKDTVTFV